MILIAGFVIGFVPSSLFGLLFGNPMIGVIPGTIYWIWQLVDTHKVYKQLYEPGSKPQSTDFNKGWE